MAGYDPNRVSLSAHHPPRVSLAALQRAELLWTAGDIPGNQIWATARRLTAEEREQDLARQDFLDYLETHSLG